MASVFENIAKKRWGQVLGSFLSAASEAAGPVRVVLDELSVWGTELAKNAAVKWVPRLVYPSKCQVPRIRHGHPEQCPNTALVECNACGKIVCLAHVRLDFGAEGICAACTLEIMAKKKGADWSWPEMPRPAEETADDDLSEAYELLGVPDDASWKEVRAAYRQIAFDKSPDKVPDGSPERAAREQTMKRINEAYAMLKKHYEEAA